MVRRFALPIACVAAGLGVVGCFNFGADLARCQQEGRCPLEDGGWMIAVSPEGLCAQGACWEHPFPTGVPIASLYAPAPDELYAGGSAGVVLHIKGGRAELAYLARPVPPAVDWQRISGVAQCSNGIGVMSADRQFYVRGDAGYVSGLVGPQASNASVAQGWTGPGPTCAFVGNTLQSVWVGQEKDGRVVKVESPAETSAFWRPMVGIAGTSLDDLWLASDRDLLTRAEDGGFAFDTVPLPADGGLGRVSGVCSLGGGEVFVSTSVGVRSRALEWELVGEPRPLSAIACLPGGELVATGTGFVRVCADGGCEDLTAPESWRVVAPAGRRAVVGSSAGDLALVDPLRQTISRLSSGERVDLSDLQLAAGGEAWAVGKRGTVLHRLPDAGWSSFDAGFSPTDDLYAAAVLADGRVVFGGKGGALRVLETDGTVSKPQLRLANGTLVQNQQLGQDLLGIRQIRDTVWVVGTNGVLMREEANGNWRMTGDFGASDYYDIVGDEGGTLWIIEEGAGILQSTDGATWTLIRGPATNFTFLTVFIDSAGVVWFGGRDGLGLRLNPDGTQESFRFPEPVSVGRDTIIGFIEQPDSLYAVGQRSLFRFAGEPLQWEILGPLPIDPTVNALQAMAAQGKDFWVAGGAGAILRVDRARWLRSP